MKPAFHFDIGTQYVSGCLLCLVFGTVLLLQARRLPQVRGAFAMAAGFFCASFAIGVVLLRGDMRETFSVLVPLGLLWLAFLFFYAGIAASLEFRPRLVFPACVALAGLGLIAYYVAIQDRLVARIILVSTLNALILVNPLTDLLRLRQRAVLARVLVWFVSLSLLSNVLRAVIMATHASSSSLFHQDPLQIAYTIGTLLKVCSLGIISLGLVSRQVTEHVEQNARRDSLTGALNRLGIEELLTIELDRSRRHSIPFSVALLDVDHFKAFNDNGGHASGDRILREVVSSIGFHLRPYDACGRMGGDEFLVLLPGSSALEMSTVCDRILREVAAIAVHSPSGLPVTVSIGFTEVDALDVTSDILARADRALYKAKQHGRNGAQMELAPVRTRPLEVAVVRHAGGRSSLRRAASSLRTFTRKR